METDALFWGLHCIERPTLTLTRRSEIKLPHKLYLKQTQQVTKDEYKYNLELPTRRRQCKSRIKSIVYCENFVPLKKLNKFYLCTKRYCDGNNTKPLLIRWKKLVHMCQIYFIRHTPMYLCIYVQEESFYVYQTECENWCSLVASKKITITALTLFILNYTIALQSVALFLKLQKTVTHVLFEYLLTIVHLLLSQF